MKKPQYPWALLPDRATVTEGSHWTRASHKGYRKLGIAELSRLQHLVGHVHLHPDVQLTLVHDRDGTAVDQLNCESNRRWLTMAANKFTIAQSLYCEGFGRRRQRLIIRYIQTTRPHFLVGCFTISAQKLELSSQINLS